MADTAPNWRQLGHLSAWQWRVMVSAPFVLARTWLWLRFGGYAKALAAARSATASPLSPNAQLEVARATAYALAVAVKYGPWRPQCLLRSLSLAWFLGRRGISCSVRIGVAGRAGVFPPAGRPDFTAHAWVEHAGVVLNDREDVAGQFRPFDAA